MKSNYKVGYILDGFEYCFIYDYENHVYYLCREFREELHTFHEYDNDVFEFYSLITDIFQEDE